MERVFEPTRVITPDAMPIPTEGHIGFVKFENPYDHATLNPTWTDVDDLMPCIGDYAPYLDDDEMEHGEPKVEFVNEPFDMSRVICTT